jgi:hypothetical protein
MADDRSQPHLEEVEIPVGIVSKRYTLVQHQDIVDSATQALQQIGINLDEITGELSISEYGSRMALFLQLPKQFNFDPGDGYPMALRLLCFNSVDGSTPLRIMLGWFRFVCSNGMVLGTAQLSVQRIHNQALHFPDVRRVLAHGLERVENERKAWQRWLSREIDDRRLIQWIDGPLCRQWGVLAATRTYHIPRTGHDGVLADPFAQGLPHQKVMHPGTPVPGISAPATNAFAISQILAWLARGRRDIQEQLERMEDIPGLMKTLVGGNQGR